MGRLVKKLLSIILISTMMLSGQPIAVYANPQDGVVTSGAATFETSEKKLDIYQQSDKVLIDWRKFDIESDEHTEFHQPASSSLAVNRVNSGSASYINGKLTGNGNVVIINQNGVMFGGSANVDVNSIVAATADGDNHKLMNESKLTFDKAGNPNASITNEGKITAKEAGLVGFVAPNVVNSGIITAKLGRVHLASGDTAVVDLYGDGLMQVQVSDKVNAQLAENKGTIEANGGLIGITAAAGKDMVNSVILAGGSLKAQSVGVKNGKIVISGEGRKGTKLGSSKVVLAGDVDVSGKNTGEKGGNITVEGDNITLKSASRITASGASGGGDIKIGGDYKGSGNVATAETVLMEAGAQILNNATESGNGGRTIIWSDGSTDFGGYIETKGAGTGAGGFTETSGKNNLKVSGLVNASSASGQVGTWLLDPTNITITNTSTPGDLTNSFSVAQLETMSASANVSLVADTNITLNFANDILDIADDRNLTFTATNGSILTSSAGTINTKRTGSGGNVRFNAGDNIALTSMTINSNGGDVILNSDTNNSAGGYINLTTSAINSAGGNIVLGGYDDPYTKYAVGNAGQDHGIFLSGSSLSSGSGAIKANGKGYGASASGSIIGIYLKDTSTITSTSGNITLKGSGDTANGGLGVALSSVGNNKITSGTGTINITAIGGTGSGANSGMVINNSGTSGIETGGNIIIDGTGGGTSGIGVYLNGASVKTTGTGTITITGSGSSNAASTGSSGVQLISGAVISSASGKIDVSGTGATGTGGTNYGIYFGNTGTNKIISTSGEILLTGTGGTELVNSSSNMGISLDANSLVETANDITLNGTAGGRSNGYGVQIAGTASVKGTGAGKIKITGTGSEGTNTSNHGVNINGKVENTTGNIEITGNGGKGSSSIGIRMNGGTVNAGGAGTIKMTGIGGTTTTAASNYGLYLTNTSLINSAGGAIDLSGTGGTGNGGTNYGIYLENTGTNKVTSTSGGIKLTGIGGTNATGSSNHGVYITGSNSLVQTSNDIEISGTGGGYSSGTGVNFGSATIKATGTGKITLIGQGGGSGTGSSNHGIYTEPSTVIVADTGKITLTGTGGIGSGGTNSGIRIKSGSVIKSTSNGTIELTGIKGAGTSYDITSVTGSNIIGDAAQANNIILNMDNYQLSDIAFQTNSAGSVTIRPRTAGKTIAVTSGTADLVVGTDLTGAITSGNLIIGSNAAGALTSNLASWGNNLSYLSGSDITFASALNIGGNLTAEAGNDVIVNTAINKTTGADSTINLKAKNAVKVNANITSTNNKLNTILNSDTDNTGGGYITLTNSTITSNNGDVTLGGYDNPVTKAAKGNGGQGGGVYLTSSQISSGTGAITLNGEGAGGSSANGIGLYSTSSLLSTTGAINIYGKGGTDSSAGINGILLSGASTNTITSTSGAITMVGIAGANSNTSGGIYLNTSSLVQTGGNIDLTGTGKGTLSGLGIMLNGAKVKVTGTGTIKLTGQGSNGSGAGNTGIYLDNSGVIESDSGLIEVTGTGGTGVGGTNFGVALYNNGTNKIISNTGSIKLTAIGGTNSTGAHNYGALFYTNSLLQTSGDITITGTAGGSSSGLGVYLYGGTIKNTGAGKIDISGTGSTANGGTNYGIYLSASSTSQIIGTTGNIKLTGKGGTNVVGTNNHGIYLNTTSLIQTAGNIDITGTGGGNDNGVGVRIDGGTIKTTSTGTIKIAGEGGAGPGNSHIGVYLISSGQVISDTGSIDITGTSKGGGGSNTGISFSSSGTNNKVSSTSGNITISGTASQLATGASSGGIYLGSGGVIQSDTGYVKVSGTGGTGTSDNYGLKMLGGGKIITTNNSTLEITGIKGTSTGSYDLFADTATNVIGDVTKATNIILNIDNYSIAGTTIKTNSAGSVTIKPRTVGKTIAVTSGTADLVIGTDLTGSITTGNLIIGSSAAGALTSNFASWAGNLTYLSGGDITFASALNIGGNLTAESGNDITTNTAINKTTGSDATINFKAKNNVLAKANITSTNNKLHLTLNSDTDETNGGSVRITNSTLTSNGGNVIIGGGNDPANKFATSNAAGSGVVLQNGKIITSAGNITIHGKGQDSTSATGTNGIHMLSGSSLETTSGEINVYGTAGNGTGGANYGIYFNSDDASKITSTSGAIKLTGIGGSNAAGSNNIGIYLYTGALVQTGGNIDIKGTGGGNSGGSGVRIESGTVKNTGNGTIKITGAGGTGSGSNNAGILTIGSTIESGTGSITLEGTGGTGASANNHGIYLQNSSKITSTSNGTITLTGIRGPNSGTSGIKADTGSNIIGDITKANNIILNMDKQSFANTVIQTNSSGSVILRPVTDGKTISVTSGTADLTLGTLPNVITTGNLTIGSATSGNITSNLASWATDINYISGNNITLASAFDIGGNLIATAGNDITVSGAISKTTGTDKTINLKAKNAVKVNANITSTSNKLHTILNSDTDDLNGGNIVLTNAVITSNNGDITLGGYDDPATKSAKGYATSGYGIYLYGSKLSSGTGAIKANGTGYDGANGHGIYLNNGSSIESTTGTIELYGKAGSGVGGSKIGIYLLNSTGVSKIASTSGNIKMTGIGGKSVTGDNNHGINLFTGSSIETGGNIEMEGSSTTGIGDGIEINGATVKTTGTGSIKITGTGGTETTSVIYGVSITGAGKVESDAGAIEITGTGGIGDPSNTIKNNVGVSVNGNATKISSTTGKITLLGNAGTYGSGHGIYLRGITIDTAGDISLTGTKSGSGVGVFSSDTSRTTLIGSASHNNNNNNNNILFNTDSILLDNTSVATSGAGSVTFKPLTKTTEINIAGGAGGLELTGSLLDNVSTGTLKIGRADGEAIITAYGRTWGNNTELLNGSGDITFNGTHNFGTKSISAITQLAGGDINLSKITTGSLFAQTTSNADIFINNKITASNSGDAIIMTSGNDIKNNFGANVLETTTGRWLLYVNNSGNAKMNNLRHGYSQDNCAYGLCTVPANGLNSVLFSSNYILPLLPAEEIPIPSTVNKISQQHDISAKSNASENILYSGEQIWDKFWEAKNNNKRRKKNAKLEEAALAIPVQ